MSDNFSESTKRLLEILDSEAGDGVYVQKGVLRAMITLISDLAATLDRTRAELEAIGWPTKKQ